MKTLTIFTVFLLILNLLECAIINVPDQQPTIQQGINAAVNGDTVLVQPGTYFDNINYNGKNITVASLFLTTADTTYISQTVIDGSQPSNPDFASVVAFTGGEDSTAVLSGFTLTNGTGTFNSSSWEYQGGGIYCENSNPNIKYNKVVENYAIDGGGIYCGDNSNPIVSNCEINNNILWLGWQIASSGGGICCSNSNPILNNVTISDNYAGGGGGISFDDSSPLLNNVIVTDNCAEYASGGISCGNSSPILNNVTISGNAVVSDDGRGGGVGLYSDSNPILEKVTINNNFACYGGGIYFSYISSVNFNPFDPINRCNIFLNYAGISGSDLYANECPTINVIVDTFTVLQPDQNFAFPIDNFTFDILNPKIELVEQDLYVSPEGSDNNSGLTIDDPLLTISYALLLIAADSLENHAIHLAEGIYSSYETGERFPLRCKSFVSILGANEESTVLDGENSHRIMLCKNINIPSIEDITIQNGSAAGGGGIHCDNTSLNLFNVTISGNTDPGPPWGHGHGIGGGIYCSSSNLHLNNVSILNNVAYYNGIGGGIHCSASSIDMINVIIANNAAFTGGGIYIDNSSPNLENVIIMENYNNGIYFNNSSSNLENTIIQDNIGEGIICNNSSPDLVNVTITDNVDCGLSCSESTPSLINVTITGNTGRGIWCYESELDLENVLISNNSIAGEGGGGIYCESSVLNFSSDNRCSIYLNNLNIRDYGADLYSVDCEMIDVIVDTFTVMSPTGYYASPINNYTFDILNSVLENQINADLYVSVDGDNSNSGILPDDPLKTITYALARIYSDSLNINTIHLAPGIYSSSTNGETFPICWWSNYVNLIGNSEDDTILDANGSIVVLDFNDITDAIISNITITNGNSGINFINSSPYLGNIIVTNNNGSAIFCSSNSNPILENITITNNNGRGISCGGSNTILNNITIADNNGHGIVISNSNPVLENITVSDNNGRGIFFWSSPSPTLNNISVRGNAGSGIYCDNSHPYIENLTVSNNTGGGIYCYESSPYIENATISGNSGIEDGGGICCKFNSSPTFVNVVITDNIVSNEGGGIYCVFDSSPNFINATIFDNFADDNGGGICSKIDAFPILINVTMTGNTANGNGPGIYCWGADLSITNSIYWNNPPLGIYIHNGSLYARYSNIEDEDPLFIGTGNYPLMLQDLSPCVNAGTPDTTGLNLPEFDLAENPRIYGGRIDMGAYENQNVVGADEDLLFLVTNLNQNHPNPFNPLTTIRYQMSQAGKVSLKVYNIKGQLVKTLINEVKPTGEHSIIWNGTDKSNHSVPSGVYLYRLKTKDNSEIKKMILLK